MKFFDKIQSRKFIALIIAVIAFYMYPEHFNGTHLLWAFGIFVGGNVGEHITETIKALKNQNNAGNG